MHRFTAFFLLAALLLSLVGCAGAPSIPETTTQPKVLDITGTYYLDPVLNEAIVDDGGIANTQIDGNARVYYQIFVGSFSDSDGDGTGDLRGIINRFDYLNDGDPNSGLSLGVEGIWLSPIFTSPSYHKYDVSNYYEIDPEFGTMDDLKELIALCHSRNVQIILDLPINHTSSSNLWFIKFGNAHREQDPTSEYYNYYTYVDQPVPGRAFSKINGSTHYYERNFSGDMPELNFDNDAVRQLVVDIAKYYLDMGVDGFRFDAAKYIYFGEEARNAEFWDWYMAQLRAIKSDIYTVAEVWDSDSVTYPYFSSTNCFNFTMAQAGGLIAQTAKAGNVNVFTSYLSKYLAQIQSQNPNAMPITFIANHDMDRSAGFLTLASGQAKVAANLSILMPGSSFIYYGEEIGLKGSRGSSNTDANRRLAMLWGDEDTVRDPVGASYDSPQSNGTVVSQRKDGTSLLNHYKKLIMIRKANPEIAYGTFTPISVPNSKLGGFLSTLDGSYVAVFHNTSMSSATVDLAELTDVSLTQIVAFAGVENAELNGTLLTIGGQTSVVLK